MGKETNKKSNSSKKRPNHYTEPLKIKGDFLEVFKEVKKNKDEKVTKKP